MSWVGHRRASKLLFRSQPSAEVLSVWLRIQDSGGRRWWMMSTQIVMMHPINSRVLSVTMDRMPGGS